MPLHTEIKMVLKYVFLCNSARNLYIIETFVRHVVQFK